MVELKQNKTKKNPQNEAFQINFRAKKPRIFTIWIKGFFPVFKQIKFIYNLLLSG